MGPGVAQEFAAHQGRPDDLGGSLSSRDRRIRARASGVADGEEGELVFTSLTKEAMPVIRYRTRDLTRLLPGSVTAMRRMAKITGRTRRHADHPRRQCVPLANRRDDSALRRTWRRTTKSKSPGRIASMKFELWWRRAPNSAMRPRPPRPRAWPRSSKITSASRRRFTSQPAARCRARPARPCMCAIGVSALAEWNRYPPHARPSPRYDRNRGPLRLQPGCAPP